MPSFAETCRRRNVRSIAVFGDSITEGAGASTTDAGWAERVAGTIGAQLLNRGLSGTVLQASPDASGHPRMGNGLSRASELSGADAVVVLYGYNDARYTAAPASFGLDGFVRDYRWLLTLVRQTHAPEAICLGSPPYIPDAGFTVGSAGFTGQTRHGFEGFVAAVRSLAAEYGTFYAAVYEAMAAHPDGALASPDITHPNDAGHRVIAEAVLAASRLD